MAGIAASLSARPRGTSNDDRSDQGERLPPPFRGNTDLRYTESHTIAGIRRGNGKQQGNDKANSGRTRSGEDMLSHQESEGTRERSQ